MLNMKAKRVFFYLLLVVESFACCLAEWQTIVGDSKMRSGFVGVALEGWNFCNRCGRDVFPAPRYADCWGPEGGGPGPSGNSITDAMNSLSVPQPIPGFPNSTKVDVGMYTREKELYLGDTCAAVHRSRMVAHSQDSEARGIMEMEGAPGDGEWSFWTIMLKNGNFRWWELECEKYGEDRRSVGIREGSEVGEEVADEGGGEATVSVPPIHLQYRYGHDGPMNQPVVFHNWTNDSGEGAFFGSYDVDAATNENDLGNEGESSGKVRSFFSTHWQRTSNGSLTFRHRLVGGSTYPYLMLYHRADWGWGPNGGYPWEGRGVLLHPPSHPQLRMELFLNISVCTVPTAQFYLPEVGGCWKNTGQPCDGDLHTDVTRYACFILNPKVRGHCSPTQQHYCPPQHTFLNGSVALRTETGRFPYECYFYWCGPGNSAVPGDEKCDPYSNPTNQEILQLLPCSEWAVHGFPATQGGEGWVGDPRSWDLNLGQWLTRLYFTDDEHRDTKAKGDAGQKREWLSVEVGPEMSQVGGTLEWEMREWDLLVPK